MKNYVTREEFMLVLAALEERVAALERRLTPDSPVGPLGGLEVDYPTMLQKLKEELQEEIILLKTKQEADVRRLLEITAELQKISIRLARPRGGLRTMTAGA